MAGLYKTRTSEIKATCCLRSISLKEQNYNIFYVSVSKETTRKSLNGVKCGVHIQTQELLKKTLIITSDLELYGIFTYSCCNLPSNMQINDCVCPHISLDLPEE